MTPAEVFCNNCGHKNPLGANFCSSCGSPLEREVDDPTTITFQVEGGGEPGEEEFSFDLDDIPPDGGLLVVVRGPIAGTVVEVNADLADAPNRLNEDPYGEGWICIIQPDDASQLDALLDAEGYRKLVDG